MTEQQEVQPSAAAPAADNNKPENKAVGNKKGGAGVVLGGVAILLALGLTGGLYLHGHQNAVAQQAELGASCLNQQLAFRAKRAQQNFWTPKPRQALPAPGATTATPPRCTVW